MYLHAQIQSYTHQTQVHLDHIVHFPHVPPNKQTNYIQVVSTSLLAMLFTCLPKECADILLKALKSTIGSTLLSTQLSRHRNLNSIQQEFRSTLLGLHIGKQSTRRDITPRVFGVITMFYWLSAMTAALFSWTNSYIYGLHCYIYDGSVSSQGHSPQVRDSGVNPGRVD